MKNLELEEEYMAIVKKYINIASKQLEMPFSYIVQHYPEMVILFGDDQYISLSDIRYCISKKINCSELIAYNESIISDFYKYNRIPTFYEWYYAIIKPTEEKRNWNRNIKIINKFGHKPIFGNIK